MAGEKGEAERQTCPTPEPCTLEEFITALDAAYCQLFITWDERNAAIEKFKLEGHTSVQPEQQEEK